ncbi:MAG: 1,4-dihydroxy-2-naphthoate octaprenyltransferase [Negativicutes bacterium]|nr:1,4-dihydroxy-2-naphthoate octaprenyltransferase [Negativicutes bacterium]
MLKTWFMMSRPWSFTCSFVPITVGAALAGVQGHFNLSLYLLALIGGLAMHAGTNLINTYGDYVSGVDTIESAATCPQLVTGVLKPNDVRNVAFYLFGFATLIGLWLTYLCGWPVIVLGLLGLVAGYSYTAGIAYKYKGYGSIMVFLFMGPFMSWPAYYIQTLESSWLPVWASFPAGFLVTAVLTGNDLRDLEFDRAAGIKTLALILGLKKSMFLYCCLITAAFASVVVMVALAQLPWTAALPLLLIPSTLKIFSNARTAADGSREAMVLMEGVAAQLHFHFGLLLLAGIIAPLLLRGWL